MSQAEFDLPPEESADRRSALARLFLSWPGLILLGLLIFELTSLASLGVVILCCKFGVEDFRTAWWLRRRDPDRSRGRTCFWLYAAWGLWKVAITATTLMLVFGIASAFDRAQVAQNQVPDGFIEAGLTAFFGFTVSGVATSCAFLRASRRKISLWLDGGVHWSRRHDSWPPSDEPFNRTNKLGPLIFTALTVLGFPCFLTGIIVIASQVAQQERIAMAVFVFLLVGVPVLGLWLADRLKVRFQARLPSDCWGYIDCEFNDGGDEPEFG